MAFDSISHDLLLDKVAHYCIKDDALLWFQNYLSGRRQRVIIDYQMSEWFTIHTGVPQGSILGPLLFSVFINNLPNAVSKCKVMLYADDTTVYYSRAKAETL